MDLRAALAKIDPNGKRDATLLEIGARTALEILWREACFGDSRVMWAGRSGAGVMDDFERLKNIALSQLSERSGGHGG